MFLSGFRATTFTDYTSPQISEGVFSTNTTFLVPGATLYVNPIVFFFHVIIAPPNQDTRNISIIQNQPNPPTQYTTLRLLQDDWQNEGFRDGDIVAVCLLSDPCSVFARAICRISEIRGNTATMVVLHGSIPTPAASALAFYGYILLVQPGRHERRARKEEFVAKVARFGDVESEVSPLSGLRWSEFHADAILAETDPVSVDVQEVIQPSLIFCVSSGSAVSTWYSIVLPQLNNLLASTPYSSLAPIQRFRAVQARFRHSHLYYYRTQFNTLARQAQREFYHENAEYIARLLISAEDREITFRHRVKLVHPNVDPRDQISPSNQELTPLRPTLIETPTTYQIANPPSILNWTFIGYFFALIGPDEHHKSTRITNSTQLTKFTFTGVAPSISKPAFLANLNRNPFETYVFGGVIYLRPQPLDGVSYYAAVLTDTLPVDVDQGIDFVIQYQHQPTATDPERPNLWLSRWDTLHVAWSQPANEFELGEWQAFITIRDPNNTSKPALLVQTYTMKITEENIVLNTPTQRIFHTLHYGFKFYVPVNYNTYLSIQGDVAQEFVGSNVLTHVLVPVPGFDQPQIRTSTIRPTSGSLFEWARAYGANITQPRPNVFVADVEIRVFLFSPSGKVYATPWERFRVKSPEQSAASIAVNNVNQLVIIRRHQDGKYAFRLFPNGSMSTLKPVWELVYGPTLFTTDPAVGNLTFLTILGTTFVQLTINKNALPPGCYRLHYLSEHRLSSHPANWPRGYQGEGTDWTFDFCVGRPQETTTPISKKECCYIVPVIQKESWPFLEYNQATNTYTQRTLAPQTAQDLLDLKRLYQCCFEYKPETVLKDGYIDIIAVFNNRYNNIPVSGLHMFRYRGFIERISDEIEADSYVTQLREQEPIIKTFTKKYQITLFLSDCEVNQLDFQKFAWRWRITNYTNSLLPKSLELVVDNIDIRQEYNKAVATITLKEAKQNEFRHRNTA